MGQWPPRVKLHKPRSYVPLLSPVASWYNHLRHPCCLKRRTIGYSKPGRVSLITSWHPDFNTHSPQLIKDSKVLYLKFLKGRYFSAHPRTSAKLNPVGKSVKAHGDVQLLHHGEPGRVNEIMSCVLPPWVQPTDYSDASAPWEWQNFLPGVRLRGMGKSPLGGGVHV